MSTLKIAAPEAREIIWDDHEDWELVEKSIVGQRRWASDYSGIFKHIPSDKLYRAYWDQGSTESQDQRPFEFEEYAEFLEVVPVERVVIQYKILGD